MEGHRATLPHQTPDIFRAVFCCDIFIHTTCLLPAITILVPHSSLLPFIFPNSSFSYFNVVFSILNKHEKVCSSTSSGVTSHILINVSVENTINGHLLHQFCSCFSWAATSCVSSCGHPHKLVCGFPGGGMREVYQSHESLWGSGGSQES